MLQFENYGIVKAQQDFEKLTVDNIAEDVFKAPPQFVDLRKDLLQARDQVYEKFDLDSGINGKEYVLDLNFGLELYAILRDKYHFSNRMASDDDIWRFLAVRVIPDIVHARWGMNEDRFYKMNRRLYLKTLYWYIHLSWMGSKDATYEILKNNSTDTIMNLVERPGIGYNVFLYREIMRQYSKVTNDPRTVFRRVLILNTARIQTVSPELADGGITGYVTNLYKAVCK